MVVDHQYVQPRVRHIEVLDERRWGWGGVNPLQRHLQAHLGANIFQALDGQAAAHHFAQAAADGQAQAGTGTGALAVRVGLDERIEQALQVVGMDADATVAHFQFQHCGRGVAVILQTDSNTDLAMLGELDGIAHQVGQHLFETQGIEQCVAACGGCNPYLQSKAFLARLPLENTPYRFDQCCKVDGLRGQGQVARLDARDVENIADQAQQVLG